MLAAGGKFNIEFWEPPMLRRLNACQFMSCSGCGRAGHLRALKIDRGQFDNAEFLFTGPVKPPETTPPLSGTGARNLPSPGVSRPLVDRFRELRWLQQ